MSDGHARSQTSSSPRTGPAVFPPLSKFYCGPAQGWGSADVSPSHNDPAWGLPSSSSDVGPSLTPRISPAPTVPSPGHWQNHLGRAYEDLQGWQNPTAQTVNVPRAQAGYHDLAVEHRESPINPGWDSRPTSAAIDTTTWGVNCHRKNAGSEDSSKRIWLMPRATNKDATSSPNNQSAKRKSPSSKYSSQQYSTRASATTIDVPLFLQPQPYDPQTAPPMPESSVFNYKTQQAQSQSSPQGQYHGHSRNNSYESQSLDVNRRGLEAQIAFDLSHQRHDSRGSYGSTSSARRFQAGHQNGLNREDARPSSRSHSRSDVHGAFAGGVPSSGDDSANFDHKDLHQDGQRNLRLATSNPEGQRLVGNASQERWDTTDSYRPPEFQQGFTSQQERRSTTATDISSNLPTTGTPESHETTNTSYKGSETRIDKVNHDEESNGSFYWHSGRSSDGEDDDNHQTSGMNLGGNRRSQTFDRRSEHDSASTARGHSFATTVTNPPQSSRESRESPMLQQKDQPVENQSGGLPTRSSSLSPNPAVSYTASALGLGGPSDWEYFGDYEAEEVDDEDLYVHKPRAELPTDYQRVEAPTVPPPEPPRTSLPQRNISVRSAKANKEQLESIDQQLHGNEPLETNNEDGSGPGSKWSPSTTTPTTPHGDSSRPITVSSEPMPAEDHRPDLDDVIRAWSNSPYVGRTPSVKSYGNGGFRSPELNDNPGEASLASTPGENVLGIHAFPKDAPPLPKLPDPVDLEHMTSSTNELEEVQESIKQQISSQDAIDDADIGLDACETTATQVSASLPASPIIASHNPWHSEIPENPTQAQPSKSTAVTTSGPESVEPDPAPPKVKVPDTQPSLQSKNQAIGTAPLSKDKIHVGAARTGSPSSEFARKRQMFEASTERKSGSITIPRKPLRTLKQTPSQQSLTGDKKTLATIPSEHSLTNRSQTTSSGGSLQVAGAESPLVSRVSSKDELQKPSTEALATESNPSFDGVVVSEPAPTSAQMVESNKLSKPLDDGNVVVESAHATKSLVEAPITDSATPRLPSPVRELRQEKGDQVSPTETRSAPPVEGIHEKTQSPILVEGSEGTSVTSKAEPKDLDKDVPLADAVDTVLKNPSQAPATTDNPTTVEAASDPYADLDPWGRASLNRFAAMLREEARVESNKDKLNIFNVFTTRETRLRVVLYGTEDDLLVSTKASKSPRTAPQRGASQKIQHLAKSASLKAGGSKVVGNQKKSSATKELPPLPSNRDSIIGPPTSKFLPMVVETNQPPTLDGSNPIVESPRYSPGGRPMIRQPTVNSPEKPELFGSNKLDTVENQGKNSPRQTEVPNQNGPNSVEPSTNESFMTTEVSASPRARLNDNGEVKNYLENRRSIYRPFATQTAESMENASNFGRDIELPILPPPIPQVPANLQPPSSREENENVMSTEGKSSNEHQETSLDLRKFDESDFDSLTIVLPSSDITYDEAKRLSDLRAVLDAVPDDFSFIHAGVVAWDSKVKLQREEHERARHARQIESEQRIDALFDDHEIGYGDIAELEGDFKRSEITRKAEEDRWEYQTFVEDVFTLVWARLTYEIDQLRPHYERYSSLMDETVAGKDMFVSEDSLALAPTMCTFLGLHQKLEIRYQKAFEAILERDRRLKKVEMSPWHGLSNLEKLKKIDKQFEDAEKQAIIDYCQQRDERANKLMDVLDQNTLRGVGANQDYMEAIMKGVRRIASGRAFASLPSAGGMSQGIKLVEKAKATVASLASSSEQIVQTFHVADMLLNNADYEVSVAKAKVAKDMSTLNRLKEERAKEDQKLMRDLEHRLVLIREDHRRTHDEIIKLMLFLGVHSATTEHAAPAALGVQQGRSLEGKPLPDVKAGAQAGLDDGSRIDQALEEAKRRNGIESQTAEAET